MRQLRLTALLLALPVAILSAQADPIVTDRPDFTESSTLVPKGRVQFESGVTFSKSSDNSGGVKSSSFPELLVRYGVTPHIELRAAQSYLHVTQPIELGGNTTTRQALYLGIKVGLGSQRGGRPELALMVQSLFPTGDDSVAEGIYPGVALLAGWALSPTWSLALGLQGNAVGGDAYVMAPSASLGRALSRKVKAYAEVFSFVPVHSEDETATPHYANVGLALLLSNNAQLDARLGIGLSESTDRYFFGFGFSIRP